MRTIQMVSTSDDTSIFLISYDSKTKELVFRSSREPKYKQKEIVVFDKDTAYINLHFFHRSFLDRVTDIQIEP